MRDVCFPSDAEHGQCFAALNRCRRLNIEVLPLRVGLEDVLYHLVYPPPSLILVLKQLLCAKFSCSALHLIQIPVEGIVQSWREEILKIESGWRDGILVTPL
jgi:hypothetical protein